MKKFETQPELSEHDTETQSEWMLLRVMLVDTWLMVATNLQLLKNKISVNVVVQSLSPVWLFAIPWTATCQASLSITNSQSLLKLMSIESAMPSNHLIPCLPLLLPPSVFPSIRVFSNESVLRIRRPKYFYHT